MFWTVHLKGGPRRVEHAAVTCDDKIFFFGGYCETEIDFEKPIVVHILNTVNYRWTAVSPSEPATSESTRTPYLLRGHSAVVYCDKIYIWGGRNFASECNELLCFDPTDLQWSRPKVTGTVPDPRFGHTACVINNCMYIFGGEQSSPPKYFDEVHSLDLLSLNWKRVHTQGQSPPCLSFSTSFPVGRRMYIYGGTMDSYPESYHSDIFYFDTRTNRWHSLVTCGLKPRARGKHSVFVHRGYLYVFGGYNSESGEHFNDLHRFDLERTEWGKVNALGEVPKARHRHSSILVGEKVFVFGGTSCFPFSTMSSGASAMVLFHHNDLHVLDMSPTLRTLCLQVVINYDLETNSLPENLKKELSFISPNKIFVVHV